MRLNVAAIALAVTVAACLGDPVGPGSLRLSIEGGTLDTIWNGAPGESFARPIRVRVTDDRGHPIPAAVVSWEVIGRGAHVRPAGIQSGADGWAEADWRLGIDAGELQRLHVAVKTLRHQSQVTIRARVVPHIVSQLRLAIDTPAVVRLGDTLAMAVDALDPYGNVFPAPNVSMSLADSSVAGVEGGAIVGGPRRGSTRISLASQGLALSLPLNVVQHVASVVPSVDTMTFSSLGVTRPVLYDVRDDRGRLVADTLAAMSLVDSTIAKILGTDVRAVGQGMTTINLTFPTAVATVVVAVRQRTASLSLLRDTIRFDALLDTTTVRPLAHDSLGFEIDDPPIILKTVDQDIATITGPRQLQAQGPGVTSAIVRDTISGVETTVPIVVRQRITAIEPSAASVMFDALSDTLTIGAIGRDRLGSPVVGASLEFIGSDAEVITISATGQVRSAGNGDATIIVRDPESGTAATVDVVVQQRAFSVSLSPDSVRYDAVGDTVALHVTARDRLGALITSPTVAYSSTDARVVAITSGGLMHSAGNGAALVIAQSVDGPTDTAAAIVVQRVSRIATERDTLLFEALHATQHVGATPVDRRGVVVLDAVLTYATGDSRVVAIDQAGIIEAIGNGETRVYTVVGSESTSVVIRVVQRPVRLVLASDTIRFDALGDTQTVRGTAVDSLGSPVASSPIAVDVGDTTVAATAFGTLSARANGTAAGMVEIAGISRRIVIEVQQVATTLSTTLAYNGVILTLPVGASVPVICEARDRNGFAVSERAALIGSATGTVSGTGCGDLRVQRSGYDTLLFRTGVAESKIGVVVAAAPLVSHPMGEVAVADGGLGESGSVWAPSAHVNAAGELEVYYSAFSVVPDSTGYTRGDLHRLIWLGDNRFRYDSVALTHDDDICSPQGQGIENVVIVPRADSVGWRMLYAAGSNACYGWQVFSAVSVDGRSWRKEPGVRLSNGATEVRGQPPHPVGEGMVVDRLPDGEWRMVVGTQLQLDSSPAKWQIAEWHSTDQLEWIYVRPVFTTADMPVGWQGAVYSPTITEIAPGLWRMLFTADGRDFSNGRSAIWSAVSTNRSRWELEGELLGAPGSDLYYSALAQNRVFFIQRDSAGALNLSIANVIMP